MIIFKSFYIYIYNKIDSFLKLQHSISLQRVLQHIINMKTESIFIQAIKREIIFYVGKSQSENFDVIDKGNDDDLWFHAKNDASCHVVCNLPDDIDKKELRYIITAGALLCKNNTNKLKSLKNIDIIYTQIKNITKTKIAGCVETQNVKTVTC